MRNKICILLALALLIISSCTEEADKHAYVMDGTNLGGVMPSVTFATPKIFDIANINTTTLEFEMKVAAAGQYDEYKQVVISKSYNGSDPIVHLIIPAAEIPQDVVISVDDALNGFDLVPGDIQGGDYIDWSFMIELLSDVQPLWALVHDAVTKNQ